MSVKKLGIVFFSSILILGAASFAPAHHKSDQGHMKYSRQHVRDVQAALKSQGIDPGPIDGILGVRTMAALRIFQRDNQLAVTGHPDEQTRAGLGLEMGPASGKTAELSQRQKPGEDKAAPGVSGTQPLQTTQQQASGGSGKVDKNAAERIEKAAEVLRALTSAEDKRIPNELLERANAIAVVPNVVKGAFGIGGRYGKGVVSQRLPDGRWSAPAFMQIGGGSFGLQLGVSSTDLVLVFTDKDALDLLSGGKDLKLGADASVAAGPVGRSAEAGVNLNLETGIWAYSRAKGLFAGIALDGAVLDLDDDVNQRVYGETVAAKEVLGGKVKSNATVQPFVDVLNKIMPKKKISQR